MPGTKAARGPSTDTHIHRNPMTQQDELTFNKRVLDEEYNLGTFEVTAEMIRDFHDGTGAGSDGGAEAPALIATLFAKFEGPEDLDLAFEGFDYMAGQYIEPGSAVRAGDVLSCVARVKSVYKKTGRSGPMAFVVREHTFTNQRGETVARVGMSTVRRK